MSFESWKEEFYSVDASDYSTKTDEECLKHCIQKWEGALPENVEKHEVKYKDHVVFEDLSGQNLCYNDMSCALCKKYSDIAPDEDDYDCYSYETDEYCPVVRIKGYACNDTFVKALNDPTDMIQLLKDTLKGIEQFQYPEHIKKALKELNDKGFAVAIFTPNELQGVSPDYVEDAMIKSGFDAIHYHKDPNVTDYECWENEEKYPN